ncbi:MAG: glutamate-5-semialdehyde dehydrogenase [Phycisphaerales bacterium]|nr:glutamate-5-semialdehyde dehydrogenase [Phycisphaerales bacterium]
MPPRDSEVVDLCNAITRRARVAARSLVALDALTRTTILHAMAFGLRRHVDELLAANAEDVADATAAGLSDAILDRLRLDAARIEDMAAGLEHVAALPDTLDTVLDTRDGPDGLRITRVRVPLGVVFMIYESRPNVTADAAGLCLKAGNAAILRGGSESLRSNTVILRAMLSAATGAGLPRDAVQLVPTSDRAAVDTLLRMDESIDLVIPRGGESLIRHVVEHARMPVLKHDKGVCHLYVDAAADLDMATRIALNAKCQRPGVCNAIETLLVHRDVADDALPILGAALRSAGVELRGDDATRAILPDALVATEDDWTAEYLDLILAVRVVDDLDAAIAHVNTYGSHHSDAIVTADDGAAARFLREVDSATVYHNASTRFTDGSQFGLGAEIGISTNRLHARGPCGVDALTTYKWVIHGRGQVRG